MNKNFIRSALPDLPGEDVISIDGKTVCNSASTSSPDALGILSNKNINALIPPANVYHAFAMGVDVGVLVNNRIFAKLNPVLRIKNGDHYAYHM